MNRERATQPGPGAAALEMPAMQFDQAPRNRETHPQARFVSSLGIVASLEELEYLWQGTCKYPAAGIGDLEHNLG